MNRFTIVYLLILFIGNNILAASPTSVGKVQQNSPPFFVDEFYVSFSDNFENDFKSTGTDS